MARKLADTKKMTREEWVELRRSSIGGSDAGTVMGMNAYSSLITLYADKTGLSKPIEDNEAMRLGRDLEQYVAERYMEKTGRKVRNDNWMYMHDDYDFITANVDRKIVGENAGLECKTMSSFNGYDLEAGEIPSHYFCQCQHYMMVMNWDWMDLAILVFQRGVYVVHVKKNEDFQQALLAAEIEFWQDNVVPKKIPAPDGSDASIETLKQLYPTATPDSEIEIVGLDQMIAEYKAANDFVKEYEDRKKALQSAICAKLGDYETGTGEVYSCTWKSQSKEAFDSKRFKAEHPDLYAQYTYISNYRVFRTKKIRAKKGA